MLWVHVEVLQEEVRGMPGVPQQPGLHLLLGRLEAAAALVLGHAVSSPGPEPQRGPELDLTRVPALEQRHLVGGME